MILGFKERFIMPILELTKLHTIREDKHNRWVAGRLLQVCTGVRSKNYKEHTRFLCSGVQEISIRSSEHQIYIWNGTEMKQLPKEEHLQFAINDGFEDEASFWAWFKDDIRGKIIHFTDKRYV